MSWTGSCNQCGLCCTKQIGSVYYRCEHLQLFGPTLTRCAIYDQRIKRMPVLMISADGAHQLSRCEVPEYPEGLPDRFPLPDRCSYSWVEDAIDPR